MFLSAAHGLCKTIGAFASTKRMRIYRNLGTKNGKQLHSRDCIYVVSSDDWRKNKEAVYRTILRLSKKQMDAEMVVKVAEYRQKMNQIEEDLLLQHVDAAQVDGRRAFQLPLKEECLSQIGPQVHTSALEAHPVGLQADKLARGVAGQGDRRRCGRVKDRHGELRHCEAKLPAL